MYYKGIELKPITKPQVFDPPREMLVWDNDYNDYNDYKALYIQHVCAIIRKIDGTIRVITNRIGIWTHCAEIPEEPKPRRATNRELANWLAKGKGQILGTKISTIYDYDAGLADNGEVPKFLKVRKWEDIGWHEATVDYMEIE